MARMIQSLNKHYTLIIALGAIITLLASVISLAEGGQIGQAQVGSASTAIWLPAFRFVGMTLVLGGVVMALDMLCKRFPATHSRIAGLAVPCMATSLLLALAGFIAALYLAGVVTETAGAIPAATAVTAFTWLEVLRLASTAAMLVAVSSGLFTLFRLLRPQQTVVHSGEAGRNSEPPSRAGRE
jgi:hypothetical protein